MSRALTSAQGGRRPSEWTEGPPVARRASTRCAVVLALIVSAVPMLAPSAADAGTMTTRYYTINVIAPTPSSSGLFLGTNGSPVVLQRYFSGDVGQHWTPVYSEWPAAAPVTGSNPVLDKVLDALTCAGIPVIGDACPFRGKGAVIARKFVNRGSGMCLTLGPPWQGNGTKVHQSRCVPPTGPYFFSNQIWGLKNGGMGRIPTGETEFVQVKAYRARCLDVTEFRNVIQTPLQGWSCQSPRIRWNQRFRLLPVAQATCEDRNISSDICGLAVRP